MGNEVELPTSLYFFTMLRRIRHVHTHKDIPEQEKNRIRENVVRYLMDDGVMRHALPYLDDDNLYGSKDRDTFISGGGGLIYSADITETGQAAKDIKRQRFGEVLQLATDYLEQSGRHDDAVKLQAREVDGIQYADFIPSSTNP